MVFVRKTLKRTKKSMRKAIPKRAPKVAPVFKSYVKRTLSRSLETKDAAPVKYDAVAIDRYGTPNPTLPTLIDLTLSLSGITQGTGQGNRVGNRLQTVNMSFKGFITVPRYFSSGNDVQASTAPRYLKMVIFKQRKTLAAPTAISDFFQDGNTVTAPTNNPSDMYMPINTDSYIVYTSRMFKLGRASYDVGGNSTEDANNDFKLSKYFNINLTKYIPKVIRYDDATTSPENVGLYATFLMCYADGGVITNAGYPEFAFSGVINYSYKDA